MAKQMFCLWFIFPAFFLVCRSQQCDVTQNSQSEFEWRETPFLTGWIDMSNSFVHSVAPKKLPIDLINIGFGNRSTRSSWSRLEASEIETLLQEILRQEAGFAACFIMGLLFSLVMLFGWSIMLCCRSCDHCGGNKNQRQSKTISSRRKIYILFTIIVLGFLTVAIASAFLANVEIKRIIWDGDESVVQVVDDVEGFFNDTYSQTKACVFDEVKSQKVLLTDQKTGELGVKIKESMKDAAGNLASKVKEADKELGPLKNLNETLDDVRKHEKEAYFLEGKIDAMQKHCASDQNSPVCGIIKDLKIKDFTMDLDSSYTHTIILGSVENFLEELKGIPNFQKKLNHELEGIPEKVKDKTRANRKKLETDIDRIVNDKNAIKDLDKIIDDVRMNMGNARKDVNCIFETVQKYEPAIYWGVFGLILLVTVPTIFLLIGLVFGICGYSDGRYPSERSCLSNCGGCTLMASVYMMFIFSSLAMLVTVALFQVGGHVEAYGCNLLYNDLSAFDEIADKFLGDSEDIPMLKNLNISDAISKCQNNTPIYEVLPFIKEKIDSMTNNSKEIDDYIAETDDFIAKEVTEFRKEIEKSLKNIDITHGLQNTQEIDEFFERSKKPIIPFKDVPGLVTKLKKLLTESMQPNIDVLVKEVLKILEDIMKSKRNEMANLDVQKTFDRMSTLYADVMKEIENADTKAKPEIIEITHEHFDPLIQALDIAPVLKTEVGKCGRLYTAFQRGRHFACREIVGTANALWFSLGACCFFFLFAIPFATKLSKHFYQMDEEENTYLQMDIRRGSQAMMMPSLPKNKIYPINEVPHCENVYDGRPSNMPKGHFGNCDMEPHRLCTNNHLLRAYDEVPPNLPRANVGHYQKEVPPHCHPQGQVIRTQHQNYAYEPDIDSRWTRY